MNSFSTTLANGADRRADGTPAASILPAAINEPTARVLAVFGIAAIAIIHILDAPGTYQETRYVFWLYMAIIVGAIPIAGLLLHWSSPLAWLGTAALAVGPLVGYVLSRSVGLPGDGGDIGNWLEPLGMISLFVETSVLGLSLARLSLGRRSGPGRAPATP